eukprot:s569_g24.t1
MAASKAFAVALIACACRVVSAGPLSNLLVLACGVSFKAEQSSCTSGFEPRSRHHASMKTETEIASPCCLSHRSVRPFLIISCRALQLKRHCSMAPASVSGSAMMRARSHRVAAPLLALGAAIVACLCLTKSLAFTGSPSMTLLKGEEAGRAVQVSMGQSIQGPCKRKVKRSPVSSSFKSAKAKQAERSLARKTAAEQSKVRVPMQWPATIPEGVTLLHLEYDVAPKDEFEAEMAKRAFSTFPKPGNKEVEDFIRKCQITFGPKVRVALNEPMVLKELLPEGSQIKYRKGAFEVMNLNTGKLMFSKLQTGVSPVYEEFDYFAKKVMATIP